MQKLFDFHNDQGSFHLYQYEQSSEELMNKVQLSEPELSKLNSFSSTKRKKEWLAVRYLLNILHPKEKICLTYNEHGKPSLSNGLKISISHSSNYVGIGLSESNEIGIDIQYFKQSIEKIQSKFIHPREAQIIQSSTEIEPSDLLHYYWTAKEAIYKKISVPGTIFCEIDCSDFKIEKNKNWIATYRTEIFTLYSLRIDQLYISFCY